MNFIKRGMALFIFIVMTACGFFSVSAFADDETAKPELTYKISYSNKYTYLELLPSNSKNVVRYTTDGSKVTKSSPKYKIRLRTSKGAVVNAVEYTRSGEIVDSVTVTIKRKCWTPEIYITKVKGGYKVALTCDTLNAKIHYTTDGSKPTVDSPQYVDPFIVKKGTVVRFYAGKNGWKSSKIVKETVKKANVEEEEFPETEVVSACEPKIEYDEVAMAVLARVNEEREKRDLPELEMNYTLCLAAQIRAEEQIESYGHDRPDGDHWSTVLKEVGYAYITAGENVGYTEGVKSTVENIVNKWMESEAHRDNILNEWGDEIGIAWVKKGNVTYWAQLFGVTA